MPHLCPMNWALLYLIFWALFIALLPGVWWMNLPKFPSPSPSTPPSLPSWHWSCLMSIPVQLPSKQKDWALLK